MGRFYADLNKVKQHDILTATVLTSIYTMPMVESLFRPASPKTDRDGDVVMADTLGPVAPVSPFREKFNFDWFSLDGSKTTTPKSPSFSPISPASPSRKISTDTASPTGYFNDVSPTTPSTPNTTQKSQRGLDNHRRSQVVLPSPPSKPLAWVWQCHICRSRYPLAVTRRCLNDGHYYCSGDTGATQRNVKRRKANKSCTSEFDYVGWKAWEAWRRNSMALKAFAAGKEDGPILRGCQGCSFPSQCRYEHRPKQERITFEKHIDNEDLEVADNEEVTNAGVDNEQKTLLEQAFTTKKPKEAKTKGALARVESRKAVNPSRLDKVKEPPSTTIEKSTSKRQRFYSALTGSSSDTNTTSTRSANTTEQGKFDPSLPSLSAPSSTLVPQAEPEEPDVKETTTDLEAIEASLKAALATHNGLSADSSKKSSTSQAASQIEPIKQKRRENSKAHDPEFELSTEELQRAANSERSSSTSSQTNLSRTNSRQSLLTNFFPTDKVDKPKDKASAEKARRAASEADIASFLALKTANRRASADKLSTGSTLATSMRPKTTRLHTTGGIESAGHFEDINLSPAQESSGVKSKFSEVLKPPGDAMEVDTDPVKQQPGSTFEPAEAEKTGTSALGLFTFGFGRK